jgi:RNA polymerase sigma-70 factor (sigma-E family)
MRAADEDFARFVAASWTRLLQAAWVLTGDWQRSEDLVQTALLRTYRHWSRVVEGGPPEPYVRRVVVTSFLEWHRRRSSAEVPTGSVPERPVAAETDAVELRHSLWSAVSALPAQQRAVLVLRFLGELPVAAVARELDISSGTVKSHTARALEALRADAVVRELREGEPG